MKIAIVRGSNMNPFEMQSYRPLTSKYELTGYAGSDNHFELNGIGFPIKRLHTFEERFRLLPGPARGLVYGLSLPRGMNCRMYGLERELETQDIIHTAETSNGYSYQSARVKKEKKKKLVITVWENIPFLSTHLFRGFNGIRLIGESLRLGLTNNEPIVRYVKENTDLFIAVTEHAKAALMVEGVPEAKVRVVPVGVDTERFKNEPADPRIMEKLGVDEDCFVVLFMGRLVKEKGVYELLQATKMISLDPELKHVKIVIAGNGPEKMAMQQYIKTLDIQDYILFAGSFPYEQVPLLYNASDAFILPSVPMPFWQEQFGMVLVEAMASGLPVITTLSGSIPEVVGDSAILIQPNDLLSIYREIKRLAMDPSLRKDYSRRSRNRALEHYRIETIAKKIETVYKELV